MTPQEPKIWIMRHGQCRDNERGVINGRRNSPLTQEGERQAIIKGSELCGQGLRFDGVFCSNLDRAKITAGIIADLTQSDAEPQILPNLTERHFGKWEGRPFAEMISQVKHIQNGDYRFILDNPTIEPLRELRGRAQLALRQIKLLAGTKERILIVSHGFTLKAIEAMWYRESWEDVCQRDKFGNCEVRQLHPPAKVIDLVPIIDITKPPSTRPS